MPNAFDPAAPGEGTAWGAEIVQIPGPPGDPGPAGPPPILEVGTVTESLTPTVDLTELSEGVYALSFGLQRGLKGDTGANGEITNLTIGSVTTGAPGTNAIVTLGGVGLNRTLNFTIPRGNTGASGSNADTLAAAFKLVAEAFSASPKKAQIGDVLVNNSGTVINPSNPTRIPVPVGAVLADLKAQIDITFASTPDQPITVEILKNGAAMSPRVFKTIEPADTATVDLVSFSVAAVSTDYFEIQLSSTSTTFDGNITANSWVQINPR